MILTDFPANENNKWHLVYNDGVPYKFLSHLQKQELHKEYPTLDNPEQYTWARDADKMPTVDYCI